MKNFIQPGEVINFVNVTGADILSGDGVTIGPQLGIAAVNIADGEAGAVNVTGVYQLAKGTGALDQAAIVYWDSALKRVTETDTGTLAGMVWEAVATSDTRVLVKLGVKPLSAGGGGGGSTGPQGPQGIQGPQGPTGPQGPAGADGESASGVEGSFSALNNTANQNVTGLSFDPSQVSAFEALISVDVYADMPLNEVKKVFAKQRNLTWVLTEAHTIGDDSGVDFVITDAGQVQASTGSYTGFTSINISFSAIETALSLPIPAQPFSPLTFSNALLWLKADSLALANDANVTSWPDSSPESNNGSATVTGGSNTVTFKTSAYNGLPAVKFHSHRMTFAEQLSPAHFTAVVVFAPDSATTDKALFGQDDASTGGWNVGLGAFNAGSIAIVGPQSQRRESGAGVWSANNLCVAAATYDGAQTKLYADAVLVDTNTNAGPLTYTGTALTLGGNAAMTSFNGDVVEAIVYDRALTGAEITQLQNYFANKYDL